MQVNIGIDFDGTITNHRKFEKKYFLKKFGLKLKNPYGLSFQERFGISKEEADKYMDNYFESYFNNVPVRPGVSKTINKLIDNGYNIFIITNRSDIRRDKLEDYFKRNNIKYKELYCLGRSSTIPKIDKLRELNIDIMLEDNIYQIEGISKYIPVIAIDNYYNRHLKNKNIYRVEHWRQIPRVLRKILK